jgi:crotonobetainyl-CoA:carnitine CoA-transferase CaiB-like acyl-CoA transferase
MSVLLPSDALQKPPLDGITVIDMSRVLSGPYCTMDLADLSGSPAPSESRWRWS